MAPEGEGTESNVVRYGCVGCLTVVAGAFSGGMVAVFFAKLIGSLRRCQPAPELPACDWHLYAAVGMLIGALTLPALTLTRLRRSDRAGSDSK